MPVGQAQGTKITWDDATDKKLLMAMLKVASPTLPSFQEVAQVFGEGATAKALTYVEADFATCSLMCTNSYFPQDIAGRS